MVYALALSRRTGLRLLDFKCAWFDDANYYEFYPLHVVHKRKPTAWEPGLRVRVRKGKAAATAGVAV
jgi:hypothetical protein